MINGKPSAQRLVLGDEDAASLWDRGPDASCLERRPLVEFQGRERLDQKLMCLLVGPL
jgi:hypothetical protein